MREHSSLLLAVSHGSDRILLLLLSLMSSLALSLRGASLPPSLHLSFHLALEGSVFFLCLLRLLWQGVGIQVPSSSWVSDRSSPLPKQTPTKGLQVTSTEKHQGGCVSDNNLVKYKFCSKSDNYRYLVNRYLCIDFQRFKE